MFDIGFPELMVVATVALLVLGPERLPEALRTLGLWFGRLRRSFTQVKSEIEREIGMDDIRRQLHNESILEEMKRIEADVQQSIDPNATPHPAEANSQPPSAFATDGQASDATDTPSSVETEAPSTAATTSAAGDTVPTADTSASNDNANVRTDQA